MRTTILYSWARDFTQGGLAPSWGDAGMEDSDRLAAHFESILAGLGPSLFLAECLQCQASFTIATYEREAAGLGVVALPAAHGGLRTPHTPPEVSYYLDQAQLAQSIGAYSAAVAMYRSALEQLLHGEGYEAPMVGPKLRQLENAIDDGSAPKWARELDPAFLSVINKLGRGSLHANAGDIAVQAELDADLLQLVRETFEELLVVVYERENVRRGRLAALEEKAKVFDKGHPEHAGVALEPGADRGAESVE
jgi:hypothetical protein